MKYVAILDSDDGLSEDAINDLVEDTMFLGDAIVPYCFTITSIKEEPKALEQEPREGHWINHSDEGYVKCPICGSATNCDGNIADLHFCFSCGAKMDE